MPRDRTIFPIFLAALFGCLYHSVVPALEPYVSLLGLPMVKTVKSIGITAHSTFNIVNRSFFTLVWAVVSGVLIGLPLGYLVRPYWLRAWGVFVIVAIGGFFLVWVINNGISDFFVSVWNLPGPFGLVGYLWSWLLLEMWGSMLGVGLFAWLGSRLGPRLRSSNHVAP